MVYFVFTPRCFAYRHAATTFYQLQRGFGGRRQHARIQGFLSVLFSPQLILQFTEGVQWFYCWENYTYTLPRIQRGSIIFQGGGVNANFFWNPCTYLLFSRRGECPDPLPPSGSAHGQCHHNGTIFITVPLLTIIVRHWLVRINDRWGFPNNTALESASFCNSAFFPPKYPLRERSESNNIGDWLKQSKKDGKDQESIQTRAKKSGQYTNILL